MTNQKYWIWSTQHQMWWEPEGMGYTHEITADMGIMPFKGATVERKNVDGDYEPSNCCWLSAKEQAKNRRSTRWIEFEGKRVQLQEAILKVGFKTSTVRERLRRGWSVEDALTISPKPSIKERPDFSQNFSS